MGVRREILNTIPGGLVVGAGVVAVSALAILQVRFPGVRLTLPIAAVVVAVAWRLGVLAGLAVATPAFVTDLLDPVLNTEGGSTWVVLWNAISRAVLLGAIIAATGVVAREVRRLREEGTRDAHFAALNRRAFRERMSRAAETARASGAPLSVLFVDVDDLKRINDALGHGAGDLAIAAAVDAIRAGIRRDDAIGRIGGDEFAVVMPSAGSSAAVAAARRIQDRVAANATAPAVSIGAVTWVREPPSDPDEILAAADAQMYVAKRSGCLIASETRPRAEGAGPGVAVSR